MKRNVKSSHDIQTLRKEVREMRKEMRSLNKATVKEMTDCTNYLLDVLSRATNLINKESWRLAAGDPQPGDTLAIPSKKPGRYPSLKAPVRNTH